jgi:hypothetical protein
MDDAQQQASKQAIDRFVADESDDDKGESHPSPSPPRHAHRTYHGCLRPSRKPVVVVVCMEEVGGALWVR